MSVVVRDGSKPYGFMPKNRACSLDFPRVRVPYRLLLQRKSIYLDVCIRGYGEEIGLYLAVAKDGSSPAVSCLKLEPKVSSFPVLEANVASSTNATAKSPFI